MKRNTPDTDTQRDFISGFTMTGRFGSYSDEVESSRRLMERERRLAQGEETEGETEEAEDAA